MRVGEWGGQEGGDRQQNRGTQRENDKSFKLMVISTRFPYCTSQGMTRI